MNLDQYHTVAIEDRSMCDNIWWCKFSAKWNNIHSACLQWTAYSSPYRFRGRREYLYTYYMIYITFLWYILHRCTLTAAYARIFSMSTVFYFPPTTWAIPQGPLLSSTPDIIHEDGSGAGSKMSVSHRCSAVISQHSAGHCSICVVPRVITNCPPT